MSDSFKMGVEHSEDYELLHYGVKGMRWGVRREGGGSSSRPTADEKRHTKNLRNKAKGDLKYYRSKGSPTTKNSRGEVVKKLDKRVQDRYDKDPDYRKAFDRAVKTEPYRKAASAAGWTVYGLVAVDMMFNRGAATKAVVGGVVKGAAGASSAGLKAANKMFEDGGSSAYTYVDQSGKILRNVKPRFS